MHRVAAFALAALGLTGPDGRADIDLPSVPPAQPEAVTARVYVGESVEIPLRGVSRSGQALQFLIRRQPAAGRLSEITPTGRGTAVVTYTHDAATGTGMDRFRYAVRALGGGFSTPAEVIVNVVERPSVFTAPSQLDFAPVAVGRTAAQSFEVRNDGGGRLEGVLKVPAPWKLAGDGRYSLGPGDSRRFDVTFAPADARRFADVGVFSHGDGVEIGLSGIGYAPIEIVPREIRLEGDGRNEARTGGFLARNVSDEDRELTIEAPAEVVVQESVKVPAGAETQVALHTRAGFLGALDGWVKLAGNDVKLSVPLRVMAAPARLRVEPASIDLGTFAAGKFGRAKLTLRNVGGSPATLRATLPEGVQLRPDPSYDALEPGTARDFEVSFARPGAGRLNGELVLDSTGASLAVPIKAVVTADAVTPGVAFGGGPDVLAMINAIPPVEQVGVVQGKDSVELSWKKSSPDAVRYELVMRTMSVGSDGKIAYNYVALPRVRPRVVRDEVRATLHGLRPGERITLLAIAYDAKGKPSRPSLPFVVGAKPRKPWNIPWPWVGGAAIIGLIAVILRERRRRRGVTAEDIERIYRG